MNAAAGLSFPTAATSLFAADGVAGADLLLLNAASRSARPLPPALPAGGFEAETEGEEFAVLLNAPDVKGLLSGFGSDDADDATDEDDVCA